MSDHITRSGHGVKILLSLVLAWSLAVPVVVSAGPNAAPRTNFSGLDQNITNASFERAAAGVFVASPTPVEVFRAELNQSSLPGSRYMGFGPSILGLSIDPRLLALGFAIVLIGLVIWFVCFRQSGQDNETDEVRK
ncbi:MAG TPA: hypothetical protein VHN82_02205 [Methanoregula sp.]|nr:hypothetical protein [Methanoregula sp.]